jgi:hypothetical protein
VSERKESKKGAAKRNVPKFLKRKKLKGGVEKYAGKCKK